MQRMATAAEPEAGKRFAGLAISGLLFLLGPTPLAGQSILIDAGGASDTGYSGSSAAYTIPGPPLAFTPPGTSKLTLRYGSPIVYDIGLPQPGLYTVLLQMVEPNATAAGERVFSVTANDQPIVDGLDLWYSAGLQVPTARSAIVSVTGTALHLLFTAEKLGLGHDTAVVSAIAVSPFEPPGSFFIVPSVGGQSIDGEIPAGVYDGVNLKFTLAFAPNPPTSLHYYRSWSRMMPGPATFSLSGNVITVTTPLQPGESLVVDYRH
jgi:hypothetical protein